MSQPEPRYRLIACEVMLRECALAIATSPAIVDPEFLPKGLHDIGEAGMSQRLQQAIDATDPERYDAILLAYGLCNNGTRGSQAIHLASSTFCWLPPDRLPTMRFGSLGLTTSSFIRRLSRALARPGK